MPNRTNQEWLTELRSSEQSQALEDLRAILVRGLRYGIANRYDVSEANIEDFAQDALLKILKNLDTFRGESRFTTWANKIAVNVAFSELRRLRWKDISLQDLMALFEEDDGDFVPEILKDPSISPEQRTAQEMMIKTVQDIITKELTERQRTAIMAVMMGGMPLQEVARRMDTNRNAIYKLIHDARSRLKGSMLRQGMSPQKILAVFEE